MHPLLRHTGPLNTELIVTEISIFVVSSNPLSLTISLFDAPYFHTNIRKTVAFFSKTQTFAEIFEFFLMLLLYKSTPCIPFTLYTCNHVNEALKHVSSTFQADCFPVYPNISSITNSCDT